MFIVVCATVVFLRMYAVFNRSQLNIRSVAYYHHHYLDTESSILIDQFFRDKSISKIQENRID